jgi:hypothetical protein
VSLNVSALKTFLRSDVSVDATGPVAELSLINEAGRLLVTSRPWSWSRRAPAWLATVASTATISLPADFGQIISVVGSDGDFIEVVDLDHIIEMETLNLAPPRGVALALTYAVESSIPVPKLLAYPTPTSDVSEAFRLAYRAKWAELSDDADIAQIPPEIEPLYREILAQYTRASEMRAGFDVSGVMERITSGALWKRAVQWDASRTPPTPGSGFAMRGTRAIVDTTQSWP